MSYSNIIEFHHSSTTKCFSDFEEVWVFLLKNVNDKTQQKWRKKYVSGSHGSGKPRQVHRFLRVKTVWSGFPVFYQFID